MEITEEKLSQLQKLSKIIGVLSFAAFILLIIFGIWQLKAINRRISDADTKLAAQEAKIDENEKRIQAQNVLLKTLPKEVIDLAFENNPDAAKALPRVSLHIGEEAQRELAVRLQKKLQAEGYIVPGIQIVKGFARVPANTELRYCARREGLDSDKLDYDLKEIKDLSSTEGIDLFFPEPLKTSGCVNVTHSRTYEIWLKNNPIVQQ